MATVTAEYLGGGNGYNDDNDDQIITRMITISPLSTAELYPPGFDWAGHCGTDQITINFVKGYKLRALARSLATSWRSNP